MLLFSCTFKSIDKEEAAKNDSIQKYLKLAANDTLDFKLRDKFNNKAFSLVDLSKNDTLTRFYLGNVSANYIKTVQFKKYLNIAKLHFHKSEQARDTLNLAKYYRYKACYFKDKKIYDSTFYCYIKAEKFYKDVNDNSSSAYMQLNKGIVQFIIGDYARSEVSLLKAYSFFKDSDNKDNLYGTLNQLGLVYNELGEYKESIRYHQMALETVFKYKLINAQHQDAVCYNNIGYLYLNQKKYELAAINFELGLKSKNIIDDDVELYALLKSNLAFSKFKLKKYEECRKLLFDALEVCNRLKDKPVMVNIYLYLSKYFNSIGLNDEAIKYCNKALDQAKINKLNLDTLLVLKHAIVINRNKSEKYIEDYFRIFNEIQLQGRKSKERFDKIQFETYEITKEKETAIKQKWIISIIAGLIVLIIIFLLIIYWQRSKHKELELLQSQQKANEEIYDLMLSQKNNEERVREQEKKRIALELHDGVMNRLVSTRLNLGVLSHNNDLKTIEKCIIEIDGIYNIEQEIRNIAHDLNYEVFTDNNSFISIINDFIITQNNITNTNYILEMDESIEWKFISSSIKMNLYRIIQEASHNINKFAEAKNAIISFVIDKNDVCLSIIDNGKGFNPKTNFNGIGLKNIKQRVSSIHGKFIIQSVKNKKTSLIIIFPV